MSSYSSAEHWHNIAVQLDISLAHAALESGRLTEARRPRTRRRQ